MENTTFPVLFGFYGFINLFEVHELQAAVMYVAQMVMILYPSFVIFAVLHYHHIRRHEKMLLKRLKVVPRAIMTDERQPTVSTA